MLNGDLPLLADTNNVMRRKLRYRQDKAAVHEDWTQRQGIFVSAG
jgi:hypothetical protein